MSRENTAEWDPAQYGIFGGERARPFAELVARLAAHLGGDAPARVADLGCGSGELTATLAARWPGAVIEALDSSPQMIDEARRHEIPGRLSFRVGDVAAWRPGGPVDLIVSNAVLQWVPEHLDLLPRWVDALAPGGRLAFQVPGNFGAPSHVLLRELARSDRWRAKLGDLQRDAPVLDPAGYLDLLARHGCAVDAWETTYAQVLHGDDPVLEWVKGTALRPVLSALDPDETAEFLTDYRDRLRRAYPAAPYGTVFPFRRIFVIATRNTT
ncbi:trans-aconitate 2-methyltransferase [Actinomadura bangladeshensis]|uniref:Trans-aconitate 2-methyltransferase n=1 Tax=Actinomadura bangladeshensis TaxID=453573 RepID=A0A6L9QKS1_9ACTN|nr:trans-aconitate 2-methyltransferase [Actinomadura bangladeshensis]NEA25682.1 trans-aconitate 2-methyltransferase [Actinomadura bangladeshensis]